MSEDELNILKMLSHQQLHDIWESAKIGELDSLNGEEKRIAEIMLEHKDEYFNQFEMADLTYDHEYDVDTEENPFLHISLHGVVENQLEMRDPIEVYQFYNAMRKKKLSRHDTIHLIGAMLMPVIFSVIQLKRPPALDLYRSLLKKYKSKKPDRIWELLEKDLDHLFEGEKANPATEVLGEIRDIMEDQEFDSLEDAQAFLDSYMEKRNSEDMADFQGLFSDQIYRMLYRPFEDLNDIVEINNRIDPESLKNIPVVKDTVLFLNSLQKVEPLKSTAKGNLPLKFSKEVYAGICDQRHSEFALSIRSEEDSLELYSLRLILKMCGWIKKEKNTFKLTARGRKILSEGFSVDHYVRLFKVFTKEFNWPFQDGFEELRIIQQGFLFSLYLLHLKAEKFIEDSELCDYFIMAFPMSLDEVEDLTWMEPHEMVRVCFSLRFLDRFCGYFGLVDFMRELKDMYNKKFFVKQSSFYKEFFNWKI